MQAPVETPLKRIRNRLLQNPAWRSPICLSIFTPGYQEGRSTANAGLALALAQSGRRVLLVDANPWKPAVGSLFGLAPTRMDPPPWLWWC